MADLLVSTYEQPVPYMVGLEIQRSTEPDHLLLLEHEPVYTRGRRTKAEELPMGESWYRAQGIDICDTNRGGAVTYHGPGQLVGYPIMRIGGVHEYVAGLERVLIAALADEGVEAEVRDGLTGVWAPKGKIGSIGVHVSTVQNPTPQEGFYTVNPDGSNLTFRSGAITGQYPEPFWATKPR